MLILRGGRILDPTQGLDEYGDLVIEGDTIARIGRNVAEALLDSAVTPGNQVVDCGGFWIVPGLVDLRTHFGEPGREYKEDIATGLAAAAAGGFSAVCVMPDTAPINDNRSTTEQILARAASVGGPRLIPFGAMTRGLEGRELTEMADLREAGALGVCDANHTVLDTGVMRGVLSYAANFDLLVAHHCEDRKLAAGGLMHEGYVSTKLGLRATPREAEDVVLARDMALVALTGARYHAAHISSMGSVRILREAKARGLPVTAEVTPWHLLMTDEAVYSFDTNLRLEPPLRSAEDRAILQEALRDGTIDCLTSDHRPQSPVEKDCEFDAAEPGAIGLETAVPLLLEMIRDQVLSPLRAVEVLATAPRRVLGIDGGQLQEGSPAHVTVIDPNHRWKLEPSALRSRSHNSPLLGRTLTGAAVLTCVDGKVVFRRS